jgi:hypothetical protein|tara:strand:+ start:3726 stop:4664 length:939 start_codon:yes stop_codon:yes gene_type:complete
MSSLIGKITGTTSAAKRADARYREAADRAVYNPWDVSGSYFGDASFDKDAKTASYNLSPELTKLRDMFMGESFSIGEDAAGAAADAESLQRYGRGLVGDAIGGDIAGRATDYYNDLQNIMAPQRTKDQLSLASNLFNSGRSGVGISEGTGGYLNPERTDYLTTLNRQNNELAFDAYSRARDEQRGDIDYGLKLFGDASNVRSNPYNQATNMFNLGAGIENMGMGPMNLGIQLGTNAVPGQQLQQAGYNMGTGARFGADQANTGMFTNLLAAGAGAYGGTQAPGTWANNYYQSTLPTNSAYNSRGYIPSHLYG